ncbi:MAG: ferrous iron transport protein A [Bacteroidota bacterium]|jgi:ferrous iron transport protein A
MGADSQSLASVSVGQSAVIESFTDEFVELKMLEMGVVPGELAVVERIAPSGDPIAIRISDSLIGVRKEEASKIQVTKAER